LLLVIKYRIKNILVVFCLLFTVINAENNKSVAANFERNIRSTHSNEHISGNFFYNGVKTFVHIVKPVNQWVVLDGISTLFYYPDEQKALRIRSKSCSQLAFLQSFLGGTKQVQAADNGFFLESTQKKHDTLYSVWSIKAKKIKRGYPCKIISVYIKDMPLYIEAYDKDKALISKTVYNDCLVNKGQYYPMTITMSTYGTSDADNETVHFSNAVFEVATPEEVAHFVLPEHVVVKEYKW